MKKAYSLPVTKQANIYGCALISAFAPAMSTVCAVPQVIILFNAV